MPDDPKENQDEDEITIAKSIFDELVGDEDEEEDATPDPGVV
jgi:hypothetical protein